MPNRLRYPPRRGSEEARLADLATYTEDSRNPDLFGYKQGLVKNEAEALQQLKMQQMLIGLGIPTGNESPFANVAPPSQASIYGLGNLTNDQMEMDMRGGRGFLDEYPYTSPEANIQKRKLRMMYPGKR